MLREPTEPPTAEPKQSGSFRYLQGMLEAGEGGKTPAALPHLPSHFSGEGGWGKPHLGDPTPCLPAICPFRVSASRPHTPSCALPTTAPGPKLSKPTLQSLVVPEAGPSPTPTKVKSFLFLTSICWHWAHAARTSAFRGAVWAWQPAEPQTHHQQAGHPAERPAGVARVHALWPRHRVSILPSLPHRPQLSPDPARRAVLCSSPTRGTIVKARDKLYHPECFMCSDCGLNLKQRGYFFLDERLYCESHAKARVKPPEGYDVVAVYPNAKVELV